MSVRPGRETLMHYFSCFGGTCTDSTKKRVGIRYTKLVFLHPVGFVEHVVHFGAFGDLKC
jgi:hypothetical protein